MKKLMLALALAGLTLSAVVANEIEEAQETRDVLLLQVAVDTKLGTVEVDAEVIPSADLAVEAVDDSSDVAISADASSDVAPSSDVAADTAATV